MDIGPARRNIAVVAWNLMHVAQLPKDGLASHSNDRRTWAAGCRAGHENPEHWA